MEKFQPVSDTPPEDDQDKQPQKKIGFSDRILQDGKSVATSKSIIKKKQLGGQKPVTLLTNAIEKT